MFDNILQFLHQESWKYYIPEEEDTVALFGVKTDNGKFRCIVDVDNTEEKFIFFCLYPSNVPSNLRTSMAELLVRINHTLYFGNFEMDFEDGEIRFRIGLPYKETNIDIDIIESVIKNAIIAADSNFELINSFLMSTSTMKEVVEKIALK